MVGFLTRLGFQESVLIFLHLSDIKATKVTGQP